MPEEVSGRRFTRYPVQLPILYRIEGSPSPRVGAGWTHDLSEGGACVELADHLSPKTSLIVRLQTEGGPIELAAMVLWTGNEARPGGGVLHGLAFVQTSPPKLQALRDFLLPLSMASHAGLRLPINIPVTCHPKDLPGPPLQGRTGNMSRDGMLVRLLEAVSPKTVLNLTLHTAKGPIGVEGVAVWVDAPERRTVGEPIAHGVRFTSITWTTSLALGLLLAETS
jgi:PilZ domain-containing protein